MLVTGAEQVKNKSKICKNRGHIHGPTIWNMIKVNAHLRRIVDCNHNS
jgi:hypothetical protein